MFYSKHLTHTYISSLELEGTNILCIFRSLDLSFNRLTKIENLGALTRLRKLFLIHNKITKIENIEHLVNLEMLELGSNRIRVCTSVQINMIRGVST